MLVIAITFVITMGGAGDDEASTVVAQIDDRSITSDETSAPATGTHRDMFKDHSTPICFAA
jgi:hypothetical protein